MTKLLTTDTLPDTLYKYRSWADNYQKKLITNQEIYFSQPSSFNDPFDGNIPVRWDLLTYEDCIEKNLEFVRISHKDNSIEVQRDIARQITDSKQLWHPDKIKRESHEDIRKWDKLIGLFSLTEKNDDILMWSHYSDFHKGFVIGLNTKSLLDDYEFDYLHKVDYQDEYPIITGHHETTERFRIKFFTKSTAWSYEKEWRISKNHIDKRVVKLKKDTITELILGCQMSEKDKVEILKYCKIYFSKDLKVFQAAKADGRFGLLINSV